MTAPYRVIITPRAASDLDGIYQYIATDSPERAAAMVARLLDALEPLKQFPYRPVVEHQSPRLPHPVRCLSVGSYIVYFRVLEPQRAVRVLHVRHGARRRPRRFE